MDDVWKVVGTICRYILAVLACWWFFWFLALIGQPAERSQELAGMAFVKAIICGVAAAIWFYRARKSRQFQKLGELKTETREAPAPIQLNLAAPPVGTGQEQAPSPSDSPPQSPPSPAKQSPLPEEPDKMGAWILIGVAFVIGTLIAFTVVYNLSKSTTTIPPEVSPSPQTGQSQAPPSNGQKPVDLSDIWGPNAKGSGSNSNATLACPTALPSGVSSKPLGADDLSKVVGTDGRLTSEQSYDSLYAPNGTAWNAAFSYTNKTGSCITMAVVEFELSHAGNVSKERHSIVFQPLLGVGETQNVSVGLRIRTPERSEDVALLGWRTISASGFGSGGDPPTSDENGFQIVKNPTDPFAAYGGHLVRATIPAAVAVGLLLQKTQPIYPPIAKAARVSGTVVLEATISKAGTVEELRVISGPPFLQQAALDAVKTWRYKPYTVNDEPVEVETTVNVVFTLGD